MQATKLFIDRVLFLLDFLWLLLIRMSLWECIAGKYDWDDGKWEWEDTPRRDSYSNNSGRYQPSPSPMLIGASPDARLVSPWMGGHTSQSTGIYLYDTAFL